MLLALYCIYFIRGKPVLQFSCLGCHWLYFPLNGSTDGRACSASRFASLQELYKYEYVFPTGKTATQRRIISTGEMMWEKIILCYCLNLPTPGWEISEDLKVLRWGRFAFADKITLVNQGTCLVLQTFAVIGRHADVPSVNQSVAQGLSYLLTQPD